MAPNRPKTMTASHPLKKTPPTPVADRPKGSKKKAKKTLDWAIDTTPGHSHTPSRRGASWPGAGKKPARSGVTKPASPPRTPQGRPSSPRPSKKKSLGEFFRWSASENFPEMEGAEGSRKRNKLIRDMARKAAQEGLTTPDKRQQEMLPTPATGQGGFKKAAHAGARRKTDNGAAPKRSIESLRTLEEPGVLRKIPPAATFNVFVTPTLNMQVVVGSLPGILPTRYDLRFPRPAVVSISPRNTKDSERVTDNTDLDARVLELDDLDDNEDYYYRPPDYDMDEEIMGNNSQPAGGPNVNVTACTACVEDEVSERCNANLEKDTECSRCLMRRAQGALLQSCIMSDSGKELYPRRQYSTRNRYDDVSGAIRYTCSGCIGTPGRNRCDVDPHVKIGCEACRKKKQDCFFRWDRRNLANHQVRMLERPAPDATKFDEKPWWRRSCEGCAEDSTRCSWLGDYRRTAFKCQSCVTKDIPCIDSGNPSNIVDVALEETNTEPYGYVPGVKNSDPESVTRKEPCLGCQAALPFMSPDNRRMAICSGWRGAEDFACRRCVALGIPCAYEQDGELPPKVLPFADRELIGFAPGKSSQALEFDACKRCTETDQLCDRMRPCRCCELGGEADGCGMSTIEGGYGLIPKRVFDEHGITVGDEYWMAMGYGGVGPKGPVIKHDQFDGRVAVGPPEGICWLVTKRKKNDTPSPMHKAVALGHKGIQAGAQVRREDEEKPVDMDWVAEEEVILPNISGNVMMGGFGYGFSSPMAASSASDTVFSDHMASSGFNSSSSQEGTSISFNDMTQCHNVLQTPPAHVLGSELAPFSTPMRDVLNEKEDFDPTDVFGAMKRFEEAREAEQVNQEVKALGARMVNDRFVRTNLAHYPETENIFHRNDIPAPPAQRALLTLGDKSSSGNKSTQKDHPFTSFGGDAAAASKHYTRSLLSRWKTPGINVLRDIPDRPTHDTDARASGLHQCTGQSSLNRHARCGYSAPAASVCENTQHAHSDANNLPITCDKCDQSAVHNLLFGPEHINAADVYSLRTYACRSCAPNEARAAGLVPRGRQRFLTGCSCASKLLHRRLCDQHRYTLASALFVNAALVKEWMLANFDATHCMFCKKDGQITAPDEVGVFFCHNCQARVVDGEDDTRELFRGMVSWDSAGKLLPANKVVPDSWGGEIADRMKARSLGYT